MPNWCMNSLVVTGPPETVDRFAEAARGLESKFSFNQLRTMPVELEGTTSPSSTPNWYDWRLKNWGTKWDIDDPCGYMLEPSRLDVSFDTAWSPPSFLLDYVATVYPTLRFVLEFGEPGMCFAGRQVWEHGKLAEDTEYPEGSEDFVRLCGSYDDEDEIEPAESPEPVTQ